MIVVRACTVHLTGKYNGDVFEDRDLTFDYGEGVDCGVIEGIEIALERMVVGETSRLKIHPKYAFGLSGNEAFNIPPNAHVEYVVKLIDCEKDIEEWKFNNEERVAQSNIYKEKGTNYFKKANVRKPTNLKLLLTPTWPCAIRGPMISLRPSNRSMKS